MIPLTTKVAHPAISMLFARVIYTSDQVDVDIEGRFTVYGPKYLRIDKLDPGVWVNDLTTIYWSLK